MRAGGMGAGDMGVRAPVAIVGMSGLMPGSVDLAQFWNRLLAGEDLVTEVPDSRWNWRDYDGDPNGPDNVTSSRWGGFARNVERFDAGLFGIAPREAESLDPQQRLLLCAVWEALENAAIAPAALAGSRTGVFIGASGSDFKSNAEQPGRPRAPHQASGTHQTMLANRISFQFDLHGPSETLDTACSSSLVAIHRAAMALAAGEIDLALAGGINLLLNPEMTIQYAKAGMLSPDGRCHTFDHRANGYVRSEGLGCVVLKPLDRALADGDPIHAVIRGSAVNHGGRANSLTAPNPRAQTALIVESIRGSGVDPASIGLVEAHGTGTALGDPIEVNALKAAFKQLGAGQRNTGQRNIGGAAEPWCALGAVKSAIGHLEAAAGIAGLFKAVFAMRHAVLPGNLHHERTNPHIDLDSSPFYLATRTQPWPSAAPRRATVSSFGFGGVNAHVVLEEAPPVPAASGDDGRPYLFVLSAPDPERLAEQARRLLAWLDRPAPAGEAATAELRDALLRHASDRLGRPLRPEEATALFCDVGLGVGDVRRLCALVGVAAGVAAHRIDGHARAAATLADLAGRLAGEAAAALSTGPDRGDAGDECLLIRELPRPAGGAERPCLRDIAHTLATGRQIFDERAAIVAATPEDLAEGLAAIAGNRPACLRNNPRRGQVAEEAVSVPDAACRTIALTWLNDKRPKIDWSPLFAGTAFSGTGTPPRRLALPGLALRLKRYPLGHTDGHLRPAAPAAGPVAADRQRSDWQRSDWQRRLLGENRSDLRRFAFHRAIGAGDAVWLGTPPLDPLRQGLRLLEAAAGAVRVPTGEDRALRLSATAWAAPDSLRAGDRIAVTLAQPGPDLTAEVARHAPDGTERLLFQTDVALADTPPADPADTAGWEETRLGGPAGALWSDRLADALGTALPGGWAPFRLGSARVLGAFDAPPDRLRLRRHAAEGDGIAVDLALLDRQGALHTRIDGLELRRTRRTDARTDTRADAVPAAPVTRLAAFDWQPEGLGGEPRRADRLLVLDNGAGAPLARALEAGSPSVPATILCSRAPDGGDTPARHRVRLGMAEDWTGVFADFVGAKPPGPRVDIVLPAADLFGDGASPLDRVLNAQSCLTAIAQSGLARLGLRSVRVLVPAGGGDDTDHLPGHLHALDGWGRSLRLEDSPLDLLVLDLGRAAPGSAEGIDLLRQALERGGGGLLKRDGPRWLVQRLRPLGAPVDGPPLRRGGSVLVSGGLGALSVMFAEHLSDRHGMTVHLCGRRPADPALLESWRRAGRRIRYHSADVADAGRVREVVARIVAADGRLDGVLHAAGVIRDKMMARKTAADLRDVLSPKLAGALALDAATADLPLDFFVLFGSVVGAFGNPGQADYAYANAWLGHFAERRRDLVAAGRRSGRTLSIDWPHWEDGGMAMGAEERARFRARHGLQSLGRENGLAAFERALSVEGASGAARVVVLHGTEADIAAHLSPPGFPPRSTMERHPLAAGVPA